MYNSPGLFNGFAGMILKEIFDVNKYGVNIGGNRIDAIKFADDQALLAESPK